MSLAPAVQPEQIGSMPWQSRTVIQMRLGLRAEILSHLSLLMSLSEPLRQQLLSPRVLNRICD